MNRCLILLALLALGLPAETFAASHQWRFSEVFSNADGSVQFIEMQECCGFSAEHQLTGKWIHTVNGNPRYNFPSNTNGATDRQYLLFGTQAFANLPNAPTPDYIIPANFLLTGGDVLEYWMYGDATWGYGAMPTDGILALLRDGTTATNSPTNFAGESGSVDATVPVDASTWGKIKALLILD